MNINRIKPDKSELKKYLYAALNSGFGFTKTMVEYIFKHYPEANGTFDDEQTVKILDAAGLLPEYLYFITDAYDQNLSNKMFFTRIVDLNTEDGLVVFEAFNCQIYYLLDKNGDTLVGPCHDLDLGANGLIQYRDSGGDPVFQMQNINDPDFHRLGGAEPFEDFPYRNS